MKLLTKEEEQAHWNATVGGGITGGILGTLVGTAGVILAQRRYPTFRGLTLPFRTFLAVSTGTFSAIIAADRASRSYEGANMPERAQHMNAQEKLRSQIEEAKPFSERAKDWGNKNRYSIVFASWVASMGVSFAIVHRNPYLTGAQKIVQARVYAQGLTLGVLLTSLAMEGNDARKKVGRWETVKVLDPRDPEHKRLIERRVHHERYPGEDQWMDMVAQEERKMEARKAEAKAVAKGNGTS
jgi:hypothetical protein